MLDKVWQFCQQHHMIQEEDCIVAGVSGGADSICLLFVLLQLRKKCAFTLQVVHVHHGIRGKTADADSAFVEQWCKKQQIPCHVVRRDVPGFCAEQGCSLEEGGRLVRYQVFEEYRNKLGATKIALAHHMGDQAETMLFHLFRGTGLKGLCGIPVTRQHLIRPLLCVGREEIETYLRQHQITWREDETNQEDAFARNKIRHHVMAYVKEELFSQAEGNMARTARQLGQIEDYMKTTAENVLQVRQEGPLLWAKIDAFLQQPEIMQSYMIRACMNRQQWSLQDLTAAHIEAVRGLLEKQSGRRVMLPGGKWVKREYEQLMFGETSPEQTTDAEIEDVCIDICPPQQVCLEQYGWQVSAWVENKKNLEEIPNLRYTKWFDYDKIKYSLQMRTRRVGDQIQVLAEGGTKLLKRYLMDEKIPAEQRGRTLLLTDGREVLWVVGHRISEKYKITEQTEQILCVQVTALSEEKMQKE